MSSSSRVRLQAHLGSNPALFKAWGLLAEGQLQLWRTDMRNQTQGWAICKSRVVSPAFWAQHWAGVWLECRMGPGGEASGKLLHAKVSHRKALRTCGRWWRWCLGSQSLERNYSYFPGFWGLFWGPQLEEDLACGLSRYIPCPFETSWVKGWIKCKLRG